jgi:hypothetical protein
MTRRSGPGNSRCWPRVRLRVNLLDHHARLPGEGADTVRTVAALASQADLAATLHSRQAAVTVEEAWRSVTRCRVDGELS